MAVLVSRQWGTSPGAVYRWMRDDAFILPGRILGSIGGPHGSRIRETAGMLREVCCTINGKYANAPEPRPEAFIAKYGHHMYTIPKLAFYLTRDLLRKQLRAMSPSSMGLDGWAVQGLRSARTRPCIGWLSCCRWWMIRASVECRHPVNGPPVRAEPIDLGVDPHVLPEQDIVEPVLAHCR